MLDQTSIEAAAALLVREREAANAIDSLPDGLTPSSLEDAYRIQDIMMSLQSSPVAGWKVGASAAAAQEKMGLGEPFSGPLLAKAITSAPAQLDAKAFCHRAVESEFAFRCASTFAPRPDGYTRQEIIEGFDAVVPAIELIAPCFSPALAQPFLPRIADLGLTGGLVTGEPFENWRDLDLTGHRVRLEVDGDTVAEGTGALVLGDPVVALLWAVNHATGRGYTVEPGMLVSTGTMTGLVELGLGQKARADFGTLGEVAVVFA